MVMTHDQYICIATGPSPFTTEVYSQIRPSRSISTEIQIHNSAASLKTYLIPLPHSFVHNIALTMSDTSSEAYDPTMEPLRGSSNFYTWKSVTTFHLNYLKLWGITSGKTPRPASPSSDDPANITPEQRAWDASDACARYFLIRHVESALVGVISHFTTAEGMWKQLMSIFLERDATSLLSSHQRVYSLRYTDASEESFPEYLRSFDAAWNDLRMRTADAELPVAGTPDSLETALSVLARSEESKIESLAASVPMQMWIMIENLRASHDGVLQYMEVYRALLRMHGRIELRKQEREEELALQALDCTWCRSRGLESEGHEWKQCGRLKEFKREGRRAN